MLVWRKFCRDRSALTGLVIIVLVALVALFATRIAPFPDDAFSSDPFKRLQPPDDTYWLGTDGLGRDILSRVILGTRIALGIALSVVAGAMLIGVPLGLLAGYYGGWRSDAVMRVTDVVLAVPQLILALALAQLLRPSLESAMAALTLTYWPFFTRIVYAETQRLRHAMFVEALEGLGAGPWRIMFLHVLPNVASPIIVRATIGMGYAILTAAVLGFLGMGAPPPQPEWGLMVAESREFLPDAWWFATFPGLAIFLVVFAFNLLGDGLRDIVDPRLRRSR
ncbi:MAG: ABC transporter permease [Alphaproteobacteria bacterium]|nr:ABC transporter permease [Alphaproteobacteria bacterium]